MEFDEDFKERLLKIIKNASEGKLDSNSDAAILFHWLRNINDPMYAWVPDEYKVNSPYYNGGQN